MTHLIIDCKLTYRTVDRAGDTDYFIDTQYTPVELPPLTPYLSRIQCPRTRLILIRTTPNSKTITLHLLSDTDLYSSFFNMEIDLATHQLIVESLSHAISLTVQPLYTESE